MKKFLALALSFALTLPLAACGGNPGNASAPPSGSSNTQDSIQISYAHMGAESSMVGAWGILFKEKVEATSDGKITVNIFSNGEMGSDVEAIESVLDNTIQIAAMQPSPCVAFVPELGVFDLPCAFSTSTAEEINEEPERFQDKAGRLLRQCRPEMPRLYPRCLFSSVLF